MSSLGLLAICQQFDYVREVPQNKGLRVESVQHWSGGQSGDSWCAEMWWMWHDLYFKGNAPVPRIQAVQTFYDLAKQSGWMVALPNVVPSDTYMFVDDNDHAHHIGVLTEVNAVAGEPASTLIGIAGNTSADGLSSNGDGVYSHGLNVSPAHIRFARIPGVQP